MHLAAAPSRWLKAADDAGAEQIFPRRIGQTTQLIRFSSASPQDRSQ
jgi:hypothetical protein